MKKLFCFVWMLFLLGCSGKSLETALVIATVNGEVDFKVELAQTEEELANGLMYRKYLPEKSGMLFLFPQESTTIGMWMKNTLIPLDMIFFDANGKVVDIVINALPCEQKDCPTYKSDRKVSTVLELNAGTIERYGIRLGDVFRFKD